MNFVKSALKMASIGGFLYLLGRYFIYQTGADFVSVSNASDWLFRIIMIGFVSWSILRLKASKNGYLTFTEGFSIGLWATLFLAVFISLGTWIFCEYLNPTYIENVETNYRDMQFKNGMRKYVYEKWGKDTITPEAIDIVQSGVDKFIENTKFYFTKKGQVLISLIYSLIWGIVISLTVSLLSRRVKEF